MDPEAVLLGCSHLMTLLTIWMVRRMAARRPGRAWDAIRQDDDVARAHGHYTS